MSGPDQPAQPYRPYRPQDGVEPDDSETTVVDARSLAGDPPVPEPAGEVPQAWSRTADENSATAAAPYPRAYRPVDDEDPTDAPLADTPGTFGGAPVPESPDHRPASPYTAPPAGATPFVPHAGSTSGVRHDTRPQDTVPQEREPQDTRTQDTQVQDTRTQETEPPDSERTVITSREELATSQQPAAAQRPESELSRATEPATSGSTDGLGSTSAYRPFQSTAVPAVAPFPAGTSGTESDSGSQSPADDATKAMPSTDEEKDPFDRPYPAGPEPLAQPEYIPPPQPQPAALDERDTFIGQPARLEEPDLLPAKRRIWQNLLGALIGLLLVLGPIIGFALLAGTPDSLFDASLARRFLLLGIIVVAAAPALLAGWAPATAWFTGGILAVVGVIAFLSSSFTDQLLRWSQSLFDTEVVGIFVAQFAAVIGFILLFAGLGTAWARRSGAESVIRRIPTRS